MQNQRNNLSADRQEASREKGRRVLPFLVEFIKFAMGFAVIIATALIALRAAGAAM